MENISKQNIKLENPVVVRKVPMSQKGCDLLRAIRKYQVDQFKEQKGVDIEISFPTSIHLLLVDYAKIKGIAE